MHKAGFVNIIGYPNVGKSTLMNAMVGQKLSIITSKAQTTRHRIMGIVNGDDFQIVYSDTPGIVKDPSYKMHQYMNHFVDTALKDADIILLMTEPDFQFSDKEIIEKFNSSGRKVIVVINKIDLSNQEEIMKQITSWQELLPKSEVIPVSALNNFNLESLFDVIIENLPEHDAFYPKDELTDKSMRFFVSEIIREKILLNYKKEIPYSVEVAVDQYKEEEKIIRISALIYVARESQKAIILGHQGQAIKRTATAARKDLEEFVGKKVFLETTVKVSKDWRDNENILKNFGYSQ
ncbi:MAG: GTPase Era [Lentimicrobiaceae bacterium]|jgi:GTP-binding protein Era|nr:GTPase Era [Lentimicrobiaceae bacterium]MCP4909486.1 GTPase Era [Bacteroidota bacterium]MBT3455143.1 GTPase Era [Lentimicrobiaceae bacterium]MBT3819371.1 GTPase Era [Lentimicrobiaceae bacterium]MBT4060907.1 GTPase Era [Lentimicrobiaceae bacterium]